MVITAIDDSGDGQVHVRDSYPELFNWKTRIGGLAIEKIK